jgi:hypothetical protein
MEGIQRSNGITKGLMIVLIFVIDTFYFVFSHLYQFDVEYEALTSPELSSDNMTSFGM